VLDPSPSSSISSHTLEITEIAPPSGRVGSEVAIRGSGFDSRVLVRFTGRRETTVRTDTEIRVKVPVGAVTGPVTLVRGSASAVSTSDFQVLP
jgi:IPT/TIG domain-containing protein